MDATFSTNERPGEPAPGSRRVKRLVIFPGLIGPLQFVLWHLPAPACA
jgi:hypothetical protein